MSKNINGLMNYLIRKKLGITVAKESDTGTEKVNDRIRQTVKGRQQKSGAKVQEIKDRLQGKGTLQKQCTNL